MLAEPDLVNRIENSDADHAVRSPCTRCNESAATIDGKTHCAGTGVPDS